MKKHVLLVEDAPELLDTLACLLEAEGFEVFVAGTGERALEIAESNRIDFMICDFQLPGMSGPRAIAAIKSRQPHLLPIMVSGYLSAEKRQQCVDAGAMAFLPKPFLMKDLVSTMRQLS